ncbi:hypothetical protein Ppa06_61760 [Planomonospora parontospora subsp. parontospora]|uniref:F5/8 type C domain-containing protein n=2 Tax=Planomonospora parontospora TaxID=58119 RepID=A0AA37BMK5_9ACTN|nr:DUF1996 domain-containing protein [Planomonospora parontospora]GGK93657.1 hypothetical protein GCM10010126_61230 [Planomonospora parontospora]GII12378.1 hypothetical protein Ppa06_61760 [Planomonospora parontospora subsp. parontospora]
MSETMPRDTAAGRTTRRTRRLALASALTAVLGACLVSTAGPAGAAEIPLSQGRPASASSTERGDLSAAAAVDGKGGTRWASAFSDRQWLQVDLGAPRRIGKVVLDWEHAYATAFTIRVSNGGGRWTTVHTTTAGTGGRQTVNVTGTARYVRLDTTKRSSRYGVSLWEFQVYGDGSAAPVPGATSAAPTPRPTAGSTSRPSSSAAPRPSSGTTPARLPKGPVPPGAVRVAEFVAECPFTHRRPDDPIVFPGLPGGSHMHSFFGNTSTDAHSDLGSLRKGGTTCSPKTDLSSYWVPTLYDGGTPVEPTGTTFYYLGEGVRDELMDQTRPLPLGLRIVAGNARATQPDETSNARWSCLHAGHVGSSKNFVNCPAGTMLESYLDFPHCWNGKDLDSPDHKSHMSYPVAGACPASHPVIVPKLRQVLRYPVNGDPARFRLASGPGFTMHGDFFNAWPEEEMERRVRDCIRPIVKCGADGTP